MFLACEARSDEDARDVRTFSRHERAEQKTAERECTFHLANIATIWAGSLNLDRYSREPFLSAEIAVYINFSEVFARQPAALLINIEAFCDKQVSPPLADTIPEGCPVTSSP